MSDGFEFTIATDRIQQMVDNMTPIVLECIWEFREDELFLSAVDPSNVAVVEQTIAPDAFEYYHASGFKIGLDLNRLDEYLGEIQSDTVTCSWDAEKRLMSIEGDNVFLTMAGIDPDSVRKVNHDPEIADDMTTVLTVEAGALQHAVSVADMVSDHMRVETDPDREVPFHVVAEGDMDDARVQFDKSVISADYEAEAYTLVSVGYMEDVLKPIPSDAELFLRHGNEFPVPMDWTFADGHAEVHLMIAPRIEN